MLRLNLVILCFLAVGTKAQEPYFLMNYSNELTMNVKQSRNAVAVFYDYNQVHLAFGNGKAPSTIAVTSAIKEFLKASGVPANIVFIASAAPTGPDRQELSKLLLEQKIENIIHFYFTPMADLDFILKPVHISAEGTIPADHPLCNSKKQMGLMSTIMIAPFSGDELLTTPCGDAYSENAAGIQLLFEKMKTVFSPFEKGTLSTETAL